MSSLATRASSRAVEIGLKIVSYLVRTKDFRLQICPSHGRLVSEKKSHSGWVVLMAGAPGVAEQPANYSVFKHRGGS